MIVTIQVLEDGAAKSSFEIQVPAEDQDLSVFIRPVAGSLNIPVDEMLLDLGVGEIQFNPQSKVSTCLRHGYNWYHNRVCVDVHFESEEAQHFFPARAPWDVVHRWACHHFDVGADACANLELHDGSASGPVLNDRTKIGNHVGCKTIWVVKPGPEPYGSNTR